MTETRHVPRVTHEKNLSASKVKSFAQCPLKYWFSYLSGETRTKPEKGYREAGTAAHDAIEEVLSDEDIPRDSGVLSHKFKRAYRRIDPDVPENIYERGLNGLDNAAKWVERERAVEIWDLEVRHEFAVSNAEVDTTFTAIMDVTTEDGVWDWKTGGCKDSDGDVYDYIPRDEIIQGSVYAAAYLNKYDEYPESVTFVYLRDGDFRHLHPGQDKWKKMLAYAKMLLNAQDTGEFPANPGDHCNFCDFEFVCPAVETSMADVSYWKY